MKMYESVECLWRCVDWLSFVTSKMSFERFIFLLSDIILTKK